MLRPGRALVLSCDDRRGSRWCPRCREPAGADWLGDDVAMSGDQEDGGRAVRRPRVVRRPVTRPGPLGELKELLYQLYLEAGPPTLEHIADLITEDDSLPGAPEKDTIARCLGSPDLPANQLDVAAIATVLAREARWDPDDAAARARALWGAGADERVGGAACRRVHRSVRPGGAPAG